MNDTQKHLDEIRENMKKVQAKGKVTDTENALFGMIDGLAGVLHRTNERVTRLERELASHERKTHTHPAGQT